MSLPDSSTSFPAEYPSHSGHRSRRRRRSRSGSVVRGRLYLSMFLAVLTVYYTWLYLTIEDYAKQSFLVHEIPLFSITASLTAGVICRQHWARYLLIAFLMYRVGATLIFLPSYIGLMAESPAFPIRMLIGPVLDLLIIWALISVPSIRRLVSRNSE